VFGRSREVRDPQGVWWYVRASKSTMPAALGANPYAHNTKVLDEPMGDFDGTVSGALFVFGFSIARLPFLLVAKLVSPLGVALGTKEVRSRKVWIHANTMYGSGTETRYWVVTGPEVDGPFDEIAAGLEQGKVVRPSGAEYMGSVTA
jgi:hypothetical protein